LASSGTGCLQHGTSVDLSVLFHNHILFGCGYAALSKSVDKTSPISAALAVQTGSIISIAVSQRTRSTSSESSIIFLSPDSGGSITSTIHEHETGQLRCGNVQQ